jgi:hypothetical protein
MGVGIGSRLLWAANRYWKAMLYIFVGHRHRQEFVVGDEDQRIAAKAGEVQSVKGQQANQHPAADRSQKLPDGFSPSHGWTQPPSFTAP